MKPGNSGGVTQNGEKTHTKQSNLHGTPKVNPAVIVSKP